MGNKNSSWQTLFQEAKKLHDAGVNGDKVAVKKAYKLLKEARRQVTGSHVLDAYFGSVTTLLARDSSDIQKQFQYAATGLEILDDAVNSDPNNIKIRSLRGFVCNALPEMYFNRTETAINDFGYLIANNSKISEELYWEVLYNLGLAYKKVGSDKEANKVWGNLLRETTDLKYKALLEQKGIHTRNLGRK